MQIDRGQVAGLGFFRFQLGHVQRNAGLAHQRLSILRLLHPGGHVTRLHGGQLERLGQRQGLGAGAAYQLVEGEFFHPQIVVGGDFLGHDQVVAGLGLTRIGDSGGANFKVALGCCQLFGYGGFLRLHKGQRVLRGQHIKVALADAHQQVLRDAIELRLRYVHAPQPLLQRDAVGRTVQRLGGVDAHGLRGQAAVYGGRADAGVGARQPRRQSRAGQQARACLIGAAGGGIQLGFGRLPGRVVAARGLDQCHQALGLGRNSESGAQRQGKKPQQVHGSVFQGG